jgi:hypothetical protein
MRARCSPATPGSAGDRTFLRHARGGLVLPHCRALSGGLVQERSNLALLGEPALRLLREDDLSVQKHVVLALGALLGDRLVLRFGVQLGRETRGPLVIAVSDRAVENADPRHDEKLSEAQIVLNCSNGCRQLAQ